MSNKFLLGFLLVTVFVISRIISYSHFYLGREVYLQGDDAIYAMLSQRFLAGDFLHGFHPYWNSGFPLFTIPFYLITHSWEKAQILLSMTASVLMIYAMYITLSRINIILGIIASFIASFSVPLERLTLVDGWTEPLYILLFWMTIFFSWQIIQTQKLKYYILAGIFFGLAYFTRTDVVYSLFAFLLFLFLPIIFERRKDVKILNPITITVMSLVVIGRMKLETFIYPPKATFTAFFIFLGIMGILGLIFKFKNKIELIKGIKETLPKAVVLFLMFFLINLPYIAVISKDLGKLTISGKYGFIVAGHFFSPELDRLTTFAQDIWSLDYPNYQSPYYDSSRVYNQYFKKIDTTWEFFPKKFKELFGFYLNKNIFNQLETWLILVGIFAGLIQKRFFKLTLYLLSIWFISFLGIAMFMDAVKRYLAFSYPFVLVSLALAIFSMNILAISIFRTKNTNTIGNIAGLLVILIFFASYFSIYNNFNREKEIRYTDQKIIGEWIKSQDIKVIMARTEGIEFYSGAKLIYIPAAPPDVIVLFAKNWGVEYILSRPHESSWPYMKIIVDPNFKHPDLKLIHTFDDGTLVWKVTLTEEEKKFNYRTGKPIVAFCRSNEWSRTDDPNLPPCPDRTY